MSKGLSFWQAITWAETEQLCEIAQFAEELGFEGLMSADHALYPDAMAPDYPYSDDGRPPQTKDSEYADMWTSFAAMAAVTKTIKLTCGVYVLPCRNSIEVAKQAATLCKHYENCEQSMVMKMSPSIPWLVFMKCQHLICFGEWKIRA